MAKTLRAVFIFLEKKLWGVSDKALKNTTKPVGFNIV